LLLGIAALAAVDDDGGVSVRLSHLASNGIILHLIAYSVTNMAAFLCVTVIYNATGKDKISDLAGISRRAPIVAVVLAASLFSLAGLPIFAGFTSKFYLFNAAATQGLLWLAGLAIFTSLIALYYYLMVIRQVYIEPVAEAAKIYVSPSMRALLIVLLGGMVLLGVYPSPLVDAIQYASDVLMSSDGVKHLVQR
jgi:NADH-quinone oxidoreductase subunit N